MDALIVPRRDAATYMMDGRERYKDTGRPVDEKLGTHVVLWIVDDADAWAAAIEAEGDHQVGLWPKSQRYIGEHRRGEAYESAAQVRKRGPGTTVYSTSYGEARAHERADDLAHAHPNPGVRYVVASVDEVDTCPAGHCHRPRFLVDGVWYHHEGQNGTECVAPPAPPEPEPEPGDWVIDVGRGDMRCGYCEEIAHWPETALGYLRLTGFHLLGVHTETRHLVVLAEATGVTSGATVHLPHHCLAIPAEVHAQLAPHTVLARP